MCLSSALAPVDELGLLESTSRTGTPLGRWLYKGSQLAELLSLFACLLPKSLGHSCFKNSQSRKVEVSKLFPCQKIRQMRCG